MKINRIPGIALAIAGVILLYFGYQALQSLGEQVVETVTRRYTDSTA